MGGVANSVVESLNANNDADDGEYGDDEEDAADDFNGEHEENDNGEHMEIDAEEQEFMENAEAIQDQDDSDKEEILYYSSEEETVKGMATSNFGRVKSFDHRPEWKALSARGATEIPPNCFIGYHATSRTWQGYFGESGGGSGSISRTHGGKTNRTPGEALLMVIQGMVEYYCSKFPRDKVWKKQLERLDTISQTIAKLWSMAPLCIQRRCVHVQIARDAGSPLFPGRSNNEDTSNIYI